MTGHAALDAKRDALMALDPPDAAHATATGVELDLLETYEIKGRESLDIRVAPAEQLEALDGSDRQRFIDAAAIRFHLPGVPAAKAFRLADELWAAREAYLRERANKT